MNESSLFQGITVFISGDPDKKVEYTLIFSHDAYHLIMNFNR